MYSRPFRDRQLAHFPVWELKYLDREICTVIWENGEFKLGKVPEGGSEESLFMKGVS